MHELQKELNKCQTVADVLAVFRDVSDDEFIQFAQYGWQAVSLDGSPEPNLMGRMNDGLLAYTQTQIVWDDICAQEKRITLSDVAEYLSGEDVNP